MKELTINTSDHEQYRIVLTDSYDNLNDEFRRADLKPDKIGLIADTNTAPLYAEEVSGILKEVAPVTVVTIPAGEAYKNLETVSLVYDALVENHFTRKSLLVSLGGGVCGDLTGFISATYMRGIPFVQMPTTLLSQVDASIGGKTGFDYKGFKNMIGAFHMPSLVYINMNVLKSLPEREVRSGLAEVVKAGIILNKPYYEWLKAHVKEIQAFDPEICTEMVYEACRVKQMVVEEDPFEKGKRMLLNYGHTLGHAVERGFDFKMTHGECVGVGMLYATYISLKKGLISEEEYQDVIDTCRLFNLPEDAVDPESGDVLTTEVVLKNAASDKKVQNGVIKFVLLHAIGDAFVSDDVSRDEMTEAIDYFHHSEVLS
ncbi:MAG: 3-dehydroquinate synthase [Lachnospiraceae bacterium]|nr:3-dehydroquinate synthase [Candidatus Equihabitans merdae]